MQIVLFAVLRHAHHFRQVPGDNEVLPQRPRVSPRLERKGFVDNRHMRRLGGVVPGDIPPAQQSRTGGLQVARRHLK